MKGILIKRHIKIKNSFCVSSFPIRGNHANSLKKWSQKASFDHSLDATLELKQNCSEVFFLWQVYWTTYLFHYGTDLPGKCAYQISFMRYFSIHIEHSFTSKLSNFKFLGRLNFQIILKLRWDKRNSPPEVLLGKGFLKISSKFTWEHPCRSAPAIKLFYNFIEIALRHGCSPVNLLHIFRKMLKLTVEICEYWWQYTSIHCIITQKLSHRRSETFLN